MDLDTVIEYGLKASTRRRAPEDGRERLLLMAACRQDEQKLSRRENFHSHSNPGGKVNFFSTLLVFFNGLSTTEDLAPTLDTSRLWPYHVAVESIRVLV